MTFVDFCGKSYIIIACQSLKFATFVCLARTITDRQIQISHMQRLDMIKRVGESYLSSNIENNEFSYAQEIPNVNKGHFKLDIRFYDDQSKSQY